MSNDATLQQSEFAEQKDLFLSQEIPSSTMPVSEPTSTPPPSSSSPSSPSATTPVLLPPPQTLYEEWFRAAHDETTMSQQLAKIRWKHYFIVGCRWCVATPLNFFILFCCVNVVVWGAFLVLALGGAIPMPSHADQLLWIEIASQVLNTFFTIANVPVLPKRLWGLIRNIRIWKEENKIEKEFLNEFTHTDNPVIIKNERRRKLTEQERIGQKDLLASLRFYQQFPTYGNVGQEETEPRVERSGTVASAPAALATDTTPEGFLPEKDSSTGVSLTRVLTAPAPTSSISANNNSNAIFPKESLSFPQEPSASVSNSNSGNTLSTTRTIQLSGDNQNGTVDGTVVATKTVKKQKLPKIMILPAPLTSAQRQWIQARQVQFLEWQQELKKSWDWYDFTMPTNARPVDFVVPTLAVAEMAKMTSKPTVTVDHVPLLPPTTDGSHVFTSPLESPLQDPELGLLPVATVLSSTTAATTPLSMAVDHQIVVIMNPSQYLISSSRFFWTVFSFVMNSLIQIVLCGFMWGMNYLVRPGWITGTGMALGCLAAIIPSVMIALHQAQFAKVQKVLATVAPQV